MSEYRMQCSEIWGGVRSIDLDVRTSGLRAGVYSQACGGDAGGDIYYLSVCSSDRLTRIALADVRGHGEQVSHISSWIYDSLLQKMNTLDGGGVLSDLNTQIYRHGFEAMTTASVVGYYMSDSRLYFSYAGHSPALIWRRELRTWAPLRMNSGNGRNNMILGVLPSARFEQEYTPLARGDRLFLYTDGVVECADGNNEEFGEERLLALLNSSDEEGLADIKRRVLAALERHTAPAPFRDDLTIMVAEIC